MNKKNKKLVFIGSLDSNHFKRWIREFSKFDFDLSIVNISKEQNWHQPEIPIENINFFPIKVLNFILATSL